MEFRVQTGIRARTTGPAVKISDWARRNGEDIEDIGRYRDFFDVEKVALKGSSNLAKGRNPYTDITLQSGYPNHRAGEQIRRCDPLSYDD